MDCVDLPSSDDCKTEQGRSTCGVTGASESVCPDVKDKGKNYCATVQLKGKHPDIQKFCATSRLAERFLLRYSRKREKFDRTSSGGCYDIKMGRTEANICFCNTDNCNGANSLSHVGWFLTSLILFIHYM